MADACNITQNLLASELGLRMVLEMLGMAALVLWIVDWSRHHL